MSTISAVLIVRNEQHYLHDCLASLEGLVDEIVVADTGSTDGTVDIARRFTPHCVDFEWVDDFAAARNFAAGHATGDFILHIDADERIHNPAEAEGLLRDFAARHGEEVVGTVEIINRTPAALIVDHTERFFCRRRCRYEGAIHEQIVLDGGRKRALPTGVRILHLGYDQPPDAPDHKAHRNKRILQRELERFPNDEYFLYQLGKAHYTLQEYAQAASAFEQALAAIRFEPDAPPAGRLGPVSREVLTGLVVTLAYAYVNSHRTADAAAHLARHAALAHPGTQRADFHHVQGYVFLMQGDLARSREAYLESMRLGPGTESVRGTGSFISAYQLGLLCEGEKDLPGALGHYLYSLQLKPDYEVTLSRCIDLITEHQLALPKQVWACADHTTFTRLYLARIMAAIEDERPEEGGLLIKVAASLSPALLEHCRRGLEEVIEAGKPDEEKA